MALIKCADCGKEISSEAEECINCGKPHDSIIEGTKLRNSFVLGTMNIFKVIIIIMASIMAIISLMFHSWFGVIIGGLLMFVTLKYTKKLSKFFKK